VVSIQVLKALKKSSDFIDKISSLFVILTVSGMVFFTSIQIIARIFFEALSWSEEVTRYLLVWSTFIGAGCVYKRGGHINMSFIQDRFKGNAKKAVQILVHLICCSIFIIAVYYGFTYMMKQGGQRSPALGIKMSMMYMAIPVGFGIMILHAVNIIAEIFVKKEAAE
jgi:TRAP-type C4-dicarboxylate transport system permease small subunit